MRIGLDRLREATHVIHGLLRGRLHDHAGEFHDLVDARVEPGCVQRPRVPLAIAEAYLN